MDTGERKPFSSVVYHAAPADLKERVSAAVGSYRKRYLWKRLAVLGALEVASWAVLAFSLRTVLADFQSSGMYDYVAVLFSSGTDVFAYAKELALSMLEALPALGLAVTLAAVVAFAWTTRSISRITRYA
jgi:hypothetical protein